MAAHICSSIRQYVCFCIYKSLILPHLLLSPFLCDAPSHNSRPDTDLFLHTLWITPKRFCHGSASLWLGLMHLFALPQPPLTMPRFSLWMMGKPINPDCVMVKASKSDKNVSQIVYHGSSCLSLSDSTPPPKHKPHPVLVLLSMNHQLPCALTEIRRFSHTYGKYQRCTSASKIRKCFQFHPNFWCTTPITAVISTPNLLTSLSSRKIWPHSGSYAFPPSMRCNGTIVAPPCIPHYNSVNFCCQPQLMS